MKKGFRTYVNLKPMKFINENMIGFRLFFAVIAMALGNFVLAGMVMLFPAWNSTMAVLGIGAGSKKIIFETKGLTGDNLKLIELLNERIGELPETVNKDDVALEVKSVIKESLKGMVNDKGEVALDLKKLEEMLGEDDKGIRTILRKQGEEIAALKSLGDGVNKPKSFQLQLEEKMADIENIVKAKSGSIKLSLKAPAVMRLGNTIEGDALLPDTLIESFSVAAFVGKRFPREYVFDIANRRTVSEISQFKVWLEEGDVEGAFAIVAEGGLKPLISADLVRNYSEYRKVAAKQVYTEEFAKFRKEAYEIIKRMINQKILRDYSAILTTDLLADAAPYVGSALDNQYPLANVTDYHAIAAVAAQIESLNFMPDVLIMNPQDKWRIGMLQNGEGSFYLTIPMTDPTGQTRMMGFIVRTSNRIPVGEFILGESGLWEVEDEALTVRMGYGVTVTGGVSNGGGAVTDVQGDLDHNRFRIIVETYFHNYIASNNAGSFVRGDFDVIKAIVAI